ncbi:UNVERIFIED_CONTAM: hypothetical protein FKN15_011569 [Acipenser sinensis]
MQTTHLVKAAESLYNLEPASQGPAMGIIKLEAPCQALGTIRDASGEHGPSQTDIQPGGKGIQPGLGDKTPRPGDQSTGSQSSPSVRSAYWESRRLQNKLHMETGICSSMGTQIRITFQSLRLWKQNPGTTANCPNRIPVK